MILPSRSAVTSVHKPSPTNMSNPLATATEEQLLQMSLTGKLPPHLQQSFDAEKEKGNVAYREARYRDAITHYNNAEQVNPMSPIPPANRSMVYIKLKNFKQARDEAAIALEFHGALPKELQTERLLVKILLRRATANKELNLFAMAADDFQRILDIEHNDHAKRELQLLKEKYRINPRPTSSRGYRDNASQQSKIEVLPNSGSSPHRRSGNGSSRMRQSGSRSTRPMQDETPLIPLSRAAMDNITLKLTSTRPRSALEFERAWKSLRNDKLAQAKYLVNTVGSEGLKSGILGESVTPQLLESFIEVLTVLIQSDRSISQKTVNILFSLTKVSRFDMLLMFFSTAEKNKVQLLLDILQDAGASMTDISLLRNTFS